MTPVAEDVAAFLGTEATPAFAKKADSHLEVVSTMVWAYTRGNGFDEARRPNDVVAAVIVSATARLMSNPDLTRQQSVGQFQTTHGQFNGFTLPELAVLHLYRRRAA